MKRRAVNVFSLSFLDIITCGLGAVILLFVLVNAKSAAQRDSITSDFRAEADRVEQEEENSNDNIGPTVGLMWQKDREQHHQNWDQHHDPGKQEHIPIDRHTV